MNEIFAGSDNDNMTPMDETLLRASLDMIRDAVLITDTQLEPPGPVIVYVNSAFSDITGYQPSEVLGKTPRLLQGPATDRELLDVFKQQMMAGKPFFGETTNYRKDGTPFRMEWWVLPYPNGETPRYFIAVQRDVTRLRDLENHRLQLQMLSDVQKLVGTAGLDLQILRQKVVNVALEITHAEGAAIEEAVGEEMVYRAVAGVAKGSEGLRLPVSGSLSGVCYRDKESIYCPDTHLDPRVAREAADRVGFRSGLLVPLMHETTCFGALKVYSSQPGAFRRDSLELLDMASQVLASSLYDARRFKHEYERRTLLVDALPLLISFIDNELRYREVNTAYMRWFDIRAEDLVGKQIWEVIGKTAFEKIQTYVEAALGGEQVSFEMLIPYAHGGARPVEAEYIPLRDSLGQVQGFYALVRDITDRKSAERDHLTGTFNRRGFEQRMAAQSATALRHGRSLSLLFLDLDRFKQINDRCGHAGGDEVLRQVGALLQEHARESDIVSRWGGEEFAILAPETPLADAQLLAERLRQVISDNVATPLGTVTTSVGVAELLDGESAQQFIRRADEALYAAKENGRNRVELAVQ